MKQYQNSYGADEVIEFDNLAEEKEYIRKAVETKNSRLIRDLSGSYINEFYGKRNIQESMQGLDYGFNDYTSYFLNNISDVKSEIDDERGIFYDVEGFAYDMGAVIAGEPECCLNMTALEPTPVIDIVVDIGFRGSVPADHIKNRGIAITNLINTLLTKKYIVNLKFLEYNQHSPKTVMLTTTVDTRTISIATIAMMCSPEFYRQISWIAVAETRKDGTSGNEGHSAPTSRLISDIEKEAFFIRASYIDNGYTDGGGYSTVEKANKHIEELFNEYCKNH